MLSRRAFTTGIRLSRPTTRSLRQSTASFSSARALRADPEVDDPDMNGGYINPPAIKREHRDPYADWWDKQERRNFGEPLHEDNDIMGRFALEDYTHMTPSKAFTMWAGFIGLVMALYYGTSLVMPGRPSAPREFEGGLDRELGGKGALRARMEGDALEADV